MLLTGCQCYAGRDFGELVNEYKTFFTNLLIGMFFNNSF